jgi:membrane-associated phospholipid phosphatase
VLQLFRDNKLFFITYLLLLAAAIFFQVVYTQQDISYFINRHHHPLMDEICRYGTNIGDGIFSFVVAIIFIFINRRLAVVIVLSWMLSAGTTQLLKHTLFSDFVRPYMMMHDTYKDLYLVEGIDIHYDNSFPSGHATSAFALFTVLALTYTSIYLQLAFLALALFTAFTRVYLLQHFMIDTFAGSVIGIAWSVVLFHFSY